jgi:uncharacterized Zn finger protein
MSWRDFKPYVPVAVRRAKAAKVALKYKKNGAKLEPVFIDGRAIAKTFWGKAWCANLESYSDYENRLPRGRTYVRNGSVIDLKIESGRVTALVQGSSLYKIAVTISPLSGDRWKAFVDAATGQVTNLLDLLQGRLSKELLESISAKGTGLFPSPKEIKLDCSCPDWAEMCKHVAAVLYGVGARLDASPELFFTLRGVEMQDLLAAAGESAASPLGEPASLDESELSALFGVEIDAASVPPPQEKPAPPPKRKPAGKKPARKSPVRKKKKAAAKKS